MTKYPSRTCIGAVGLLALAALSACDDQPTGPSRPERPAAIPYDRSAYVIPLAIDNEGAARGAGVVLNVIGSPGSPNVIVNGSFESGGVALSGWTIFNEGGSFGSWFLQSGTGSPLNGFAVPSPTDGANAAMTDQFGPGSHILYQDVTVPAGAALTFDVFIGNSTDAFWTPASLSWQEFPNQQARADIMTTTSAVADVGTGVIMNLYQTAAGDPLVSGYTTVTKSLAALAGQTVRVRFSEVDNYGYFNMGIDNVSLRTTYEDLCSSIQTLVSQPGVGKSLCAKLTAAAAAEERCDESAQNGILRAFNQQVEAQRGKSISESDADLLISASQSLMAA